MGEWEAHTKGIGMKLLMKMGYIHPTVCVYLDVTIHNYFSSTLFYNLSSPFLDRYLFICYRYKRGEGLGIDGGGIIKPVRAATAPKENAGIGHDGESSANRVNDEELDELPKKRKGSSFWTLAV